MEESNEQAKYKKINIDYLYVVIPDNNMVYVPLSDYSGSDGRHCVRKLYCICLHAAWFYLFWANFLRLALPYGRYAGMSVFGK